MAALAVIGGAIAVGSQIGSSLGKYALSSASSSTHGSHSDKPDQKGSDSDADDSARSASGTITYEAWQQVKIGSGTGTTKAEAEKLFGKKADSTSSTTTNNVASDRLRWQGLKDGATTSWVSIQFQDDHAIMKSIYGLVAKRDDKITLAQYQKIANGQSTKDVEAALGRPDSVMVTNFGSPRETWHYTTGLNSSSSGYISITFKDGVVADLSQSNLQ